MGESGQPFSPVDQPQDQRNWTPMLIGAALVVVAIAGIVLATRAGRSAGSANPVDPDLSRVQLSDLHMAEAQNFAGNSVTYIEGKVANHTDRRVTAIRVSLVFKNSMGEIAQEEKALPLAVLLPNVPYVDYGPVDRAPLAPGQVRDFRLTLEHVSLDWDRQIPQVKVVSLAY